MNEIQEIARTAIAEVISEQTPPKTEWDDSPLADFMRVEIDTRGTVGERLVVKLLEKGGLNPVYNPSATDTEKHWDLMCNDLSYEVKTASVGKDGTVFQHESIYRQRPYDGIILVDIAPDEIYISLWAKAAVPWKALHFRHHGGFYKWDTSLTSLRTMQRNGKRRKFCVRRNVVRTVADFMERWAKMEEVIWAKKRPASSL